MPRLPTGQIVDRRSRGIFARVRWIDDNGHERTRERKLRSRSHGPAVIRQLLSEIEEESVGSASDLTFSELADVYIAARVTDAEYRGDRKVSGMRARRQAKVETDALKKYFGDQRISELSYHDLEEYRNHQLSTPFLEAKDDKPAKFRKISSVNHSLRRLRAILNFAVQRGWLTTNPFARGPALISAADETPRNRPRGEDEEEKLLAQCTGRRAHLRAILIAAIDTAMRQGEILHLERRDVDLERGLITVRAFITKTMTQRMVPISDRLRVELEAILEKIEPEPEALLFGGIQSIKTAFRGICNDAGVTNLNFHDLRHWATTDLVAAFTQAGLAVQHVMKITGHSQDKTFRRYIRTDEEIVKQGGLALEKLRQSKRGERSPIQELKGVRRRTSG
jgi:integrase